MDDSRGRWRRRHKTAIIAVLSVALLLTVAGSVALLFLEQRRWHQAREFEQSRLYQVREHMNNLQKSAENEEQLASSEIAAGRFASAVGILQQACDRLLAEPSLEPLRPSCNSPGARASSGTVLPAMPNEPRTLGFRGEERGSADRRGCRSEPPLRLPATTTGGIICRTPICPCPARALAERGLPADTPGRHSVQPCLRSPNEPAACDVGHWIACARERFGHRCPPGSCNWPYEPAPTEDARDTPPTSLKPTGAIDSLFPRHYPLCDDHSGRTSHLSNE